MSSASHRVRAHDILRSIDEAKQQREQNDTLRNTLLDAEDILNDLHSQLFARRMYEEISRARREANDYHESYEGQLCYSATIKRHHASRYMADCSLTVPEGQLTTDETLSSQRAIDLACAKFVELRRAIDGVLGRERGARRSDSVLKGERISNASMSSESGSPTLQLSSTKKPGDAAQIVDPISKDEQGDQETSIDGPLASALGIFFETALERLEQCRHLVEAARVESEPWLPVIEPVIQLLSELVTLKPVGQPLRDLDSEINKLMAVDEELVVKQDQAIEDGNITENEAVAHQRITLLEAVADLITQKFTVLDGQEEELVRRKKHRALAVQQQCGTVLTTIRRGVQDKRKEIQADIAKVTKEKRRAENDEDLARSSFLQEKQRTDDVLEANSREQEDLWQEMFRIEARLAELAKQRRDEIERRVKLVEREERRRVDMQHFMDFVNTHIQLLTATLRSRDAEDNLDNVFEDIAQTAMNITTSHFDGVQRQLDDLRQKSLMEHLNHFKRQYITVGDLMFKKSRYIDELDKRIEFYVIQQETAMDSLDPKARVLTLEKERLQDEKVRVNKTISVLKQKVALYIEAFKPTEKAIKSHGNMVFVHPLKELQTSNHEKGRKMAAYYALIVKEKDPARDPSVAHLIESEHEIRAQQEQLDEERRNWVPYHKKKVVATGPGGLPLTAGYQQHKRFTVTEDDSDVASCATDPYHKGQDTGRSLDSDSSAFETPTQLSQAAARQRQMQGFADAAGKSKSQEPKKRVPRVIGRTDPPF